MSWLGFWLFLAIVYACDAWLYSVGHNTFFFGHKTPEELRLREAAIRTAEMFAGIPAPDKGIGVSQ